MQICLWFLEKLKKNSRNEGFLEVVVMGWKNIWTGKFGNREWPSYLKIGLMKYFVSIGLLQLGIKHFRQGKPNECRISVTHEFHDFSPMVIVMQKDLSYR